MMSSLSTSSYKMVAMASTLMPFLYHTRTLTTVRSTQLFRLPATSATCRRTFQIHHKLGAAGARKDITFDSVPEIPVANPPNPFERTLDPPEWDDGNSTVIRKVAWDKSPMEREPAAHGSSIPFEDAGEDTANMDFMSASDPFLTEQDIFNEDYDESEHWPKPSGDRRSAKSTITVQERDAFRRIFADIRAFSKSSGRPLDDEFNHDYTSGAPRPVTKVPETKQMKQTAAQESVLTMIERAAGPNDPAFSLKTQDKLLEDVEQYPQPLRAAAAKALGLVSGKNIKNTMEDDVDQLEALRQPELERVEVALRAAGTDIELWSVMEREVFSLPRKLGLVDIDQKPRARVKKGRKRKSVAEQATGGEETVLQEEAPGMNLSIHGPLYPSHLLLSLRLLDRSFEKPSSLVLNILPRIKSLGLISHALGASTALYNELLRIYWVRYDNFRGVLDLLMEMERVGLEVDEETLSIVSHIAKLQSGIKAGGKGSVVQALWSMPEFAPGQFIPWVRKLEALLQAREPSA